MVDSGKIDGIFDADFLRKLSELRTGFTLRKMAALVLPFP